MRADVGIRPYGAGSCFEWLMAPSEDWSRVGAEAWVESVPSSARVEDKVQRGDVQQAAKEYGME